MLLDETIVSGSRWCEMEKVTPIDLKSRWIAVGIIISFWFIGNSVFSQERAELEENPIFMEPIVVELQNLNRKSKQFKEDYNFLKKAAGELGAEVGRTLVSEESFYLLLDFSALQTASDASLAMDIVENVPSVEKVFPGSAFNLEVHNLDKLERFENGESIPDRKLYGIRSKRENFNPDMESPHVPGEILVKYLESLPGELPLDESSADLTSFKSRVEARTKKTLNAKGGKLELIEISTDAISLEDAISELNNMDIIEYAEPNYTLQLLATPNDPDYNSLWGMDKIKAEDAWDTRTATSSGVVVAVTDSGMQYTHHDLQPNRWVNTGEIAGNNIDDDSNGYIDDIYGWNPIGGDGDPWDDLDVSGTALDYHGTHVSGTIGAKGNNSIDVAGVAWTTKIMSIRIFDSNGGTTTPAINEGLQYAIDNGATVINASWGGGPFTQSLKDKLEEVRDAGISFINSAGNGDTFGNPIDHDSTKVYPSGYNLANILAVAASDSSDALTSFSDFGRWSVDLAAPGDDILSTLNSNGTDTKDGTSMAAPHVTGVYALAKSEFPWESNTELLDRLRFSVDKVSGLATKTITGGRLNADEALGERPTIFNLSTRAEVKTGSEIVISGFAITGSNSKRVSLRARGPSLGITGQISDTKIELYSGTTLLASNDNWTTLPQADKNELTSKGFAPTHNLESAWIGNLNPGVYTVHLKGPSGQTGIGIIESFDIDGDNVDRLINVSTRSFVGTGSNISIGGGWIVGDKPRRVLIRALGETLDGFGISNYLPDPKLALYRGSTLVASNDDWKDFDGTSEELEEKISEFGLAPTYDEESIIVYDIDAGGFTVHFSDSGGSTGVGIIEIFEFGSKKY